MRSVNIVMKDDSDGVYFPATCRLLYIGEQEEKSTKKVALVGDSTIDNIYWVNQGPYEERTDTVLAQTAASLAGMKTAINYKIGNFAIDGATTSDLLGKVYMNKVVPVSTAHPWLSVKPLEKMLSWKPNTVVLSVGGNNYREALQVELVEHISTLRALLRLTPDTAKEPVAEIFDSVEKKLLDDYKKIIDIILSATNVTRLVLASQYYPAITMFTPYFIYTGFSHVARAQNFEQPDALTAVQHAMEKSYREILDYVVEKNKEAKKEIVYVDMASSLNPLAGYHSLQIEPNEQGSRVMGKLIATAVGHEVADNNSILRVVSNGAEISAQPLNNDELKQLKIRSPGDWISKNRYHHLIPSCNISFSKRLEHTYHFFAGQHFDAQYSGMFALGLIDISVVTIIAAYLWRHAINQERYLVTRIPAAIIATPILFVRCLVGAICTLAVLPLVGMFHLLTKPCRKKSPVTFTKTDCTLFHSEGNTSKQDAVTTDTHKLSHNNVATI